MHVIYHRVHFVLLFNGDILLFRVKLMQMTLSRRWKCWTKTTMAKSTSESFVDVCVTWQNVITTRRRAREAREARAKNKKIDKKTEKG